MTGLLDDLMEEDAADATVPTDDALEGIAALVREQQELQRSAEQAKKLYDDTNKELRKISEKRLPEAMAAIGLSSVTTKDGHKVDIKEEVYASISEKNREAALQWLRDTGFDDLIKNDITVSFGKGEDDLAGSMLAELEETGYACVQKTTVHAGTLKAFIKEQLKLGNDIPLETFNAFVFQKATIK